MVNGACCFIQTLSVALWLVNWLKNVVYLSQFVLLAWLKMPTVLLVAVIWMSRAPDRECGDSGR